MKTFVVHPSWETMIDFLPASAIDDALGGRGPLASRVELVAVADADADAEVITVDEAATRFGLTRDEVLATFDDDLSPSRSLCSSP